MSLSHAGSSRISHGVSLRFITFAVAAALAFGWLLVWRPPSALAVCAAPVTDGTGHTTVTFCYTGAIQTWIVPAGVTSATFHLFGARGGGRFEGETPGGKGGEATAPLAVTPGATITIVVGGVGADGGSGMTNPAGGFNGGGQGGISSNGDCTSCDSAAGGGGATDVRIGGAAPANRALVAGGGGGAGDKGGGAGGGLAGLPGGAAGTNDGKGGTELAGGLGGVGGAQHPDGDAGSLGDGGDGANDTGEDLGGGGGGGGQYGGGGGAAYGSGGGGSGSGPDGTAYGIGVNAGFGLATVTYAVRAQATPTPTPRQVTLPPTNTSPPTAEGGSVVGPASWLAVAVILVTSIMVIAAGPSLRRRR